MTYTQFIEAHPELQGLDQATKDIAYQQYCEQLDDAINQLEGD